MDRRRWLKHTATLAGGTTAAAALAAAGCGREMPGPTDTGATAGTPTTTGSVTTPDNAVVGTTAGKIRGFVRNGVFVFKGVPYGDTTAGENRFMPPKPVKPWTDVRATVQAILH
jgi:para-nitrobenzyl esterase